MDIQKELLLWVGAALVCAMVVSFIMCPLVKSFAYKIGAIDVPKDSRRMHKKPVPRLGGLAIFLGFMVSILLFVHIDHQMKGILLGAVIIVVLGVVDDMTPLRAKFKFLVQICAALVAVYHGVVIEILTNPNVFSDAPYWSLGWMKYPVTVLWIVGVTNAVNLIDGLDGLASGVSTISAMTMLVIAILVSEQQVAIVMAALAGACLGFMPYNKNPAKMFMGDTGSLFLGGAVAALAFAYDMPLILLLVGFVYLCETLSDIIQVTYFKLTHGKRIFKMAPLHHHFEMCGWKETKVVAVFAAVSTVFCVLAYLGVMDRFGA